MSNKRVYEIAKELNVSNKDMIDKITAMGIDAKSHMSVLEDIDVIAIRNAFLYSQKKSETKIVKIQHKKQEITQEATAKAQPQTIQRESIQPGAPAHPPMQRQESSAPRSQEHIKKASPVPSEKPVSPHREPGYQAPAQPSEKPTPMQEQPEPSSTQQSNTESRSPQSTQPQNRPVQSGDYRSQQQNPGTPRPHTDQARPPQTSQQGQNSQPRPYQPGQQGQNSQSRPYQPGQQGQNSQSRPYQSGQQGQNSQSRPYQPGQPRPPQSGQPRPYQPGQQGQNSQSRPYQPGQPRPPQPGFSKDRNEGPGGSGQRTKPSGPPSKPGATPERRNSTPGGKPAPYRKDDKSGDNKKTKEREPVSLMRKPVRQAPKKSYAVKEAPPVPVELPPGSKLINVPITVKGLSEQIDKSTSAIIMSLMRLGVMANINQNIDEETLLILGSELGVDIVIGKIEEEAVEIGIETFADKPEDLKSRAPIITVMGHVDHGKTSLLDCIRKTKVTAMESGGITQHIGASEVVSNGHKIVFLDTPGHEAFTAMRARGAHTTDIAVLVVAADDSVKPQTVEAISHAKAANVPIIVAINKMDKPGADPTRVKQDLTSHGLLVEDWGGDIISVPVSAKTGEGIDQLLEMILLQAEVLELKANPNRLAVGSVIEARLDKNRGPVATLLVLNGTLHTGDSIVAGTCSGKIKAMTDFKGDTIKKAGPGTAVEILGLAEIPEAGDGFNGVKEDKVARDIAESRRIKLREEIMARNSSTTLEQLFSQIQEGEVKELNLIIKADVQGSAGALTQSLEKLKNENVKVRIIYAAVGTVTESDIMLANTSKAIIIGFNVRPSTLISSMADREGVEIRTYRVIYEVIDDIEAAMKGMLDPVYKEVVLGKVEIRNTFKVPGVGVIAGAYVLEGKVQRNASIRLVRDGIVVHEGKISSLKRFKDDAKEVNQGFECGVGIENFNDIKESDIIEAYKMEEIERK